VSERIGISLDILKWGDLVGAIAAPASHQDKIVVVRLAIDFPHAGSG